MDEQQDSLLADLCRSMANNPNILKFSDLAVAASKGAVVGQKTGNPHGVWIGAVVGVTVKASEAALALSTELAEQLVGGTPTQPAVEVPQSTARPSKATKKL